MKIKVALKHSYPAASFLISFIIYILTTAPSLTYTDAGELAGVCVTLGISHPTGYPLFTILGHLWTLLPLPFSMIYKLNIFAAFCTALSVLVFFYLNKAIFNYLALQKKAFRSSKKQKSKQQTTTIVKATIMNENQILILSLIVALTYAFTLTVWQQATAIEVYSLQLLMFNLILLSLFKAVTDVDYSRQYFILSAFLLGLGFSNHMTTILLIPSVIYIYFKRPGQKFKIDGNRLLFLLLLIIPFAIGLSLYLYLPLRSAMLPEFNWGWVHRSLGKFLYHVKGTQYQVWMFTGPDVWKENIGKFFDTFPIQYAWIQFLAVIYGFYILFKTSKTLMIFLILLFISCVFYAINYSIHDIQSYFLLAFISLIILAGIGIWGFSLRFHKILPFFFIIPILSLIFNYNENDISDEQPVPEYVKILSKNLQPGAIIISAQWDFWCSAFWYLQRVEGYRQDIVLIEKELLRRTWYPRQLLRWYPEAVGQCKNSIQDYLTELDKFESGGDYNPYRIQDYYISMVNNIIDKNYGKRPIYLTNEIYFQQNQVKIDTLIGAGYIKIPEGFALRLEKENKVYPISVDKININGFMRALNGRKDDLTDGIRRSALFYIVDATAQYAITTGQVDIGLKALRLGLALDPDNLNLFNTIRQIESRRMQMKSILDSAALNQR